MSVADTCMIMWTCRKELMDTPDLSTPVAHFGTNLSDPDFGLFRTADMPDVDMFPEVVSYVEEV